MNLYYPLHETIFWTLVERDVLKDYVQKMKETPVTVIWSDKEISAWDRTVGLCEALVRMPAYKDLPKRKQHELFLAALLLFISLDSKCKPRVASHAARAYLYKDCGLSGSLDDIQFRETVCSLIAHCFLALNILESPGEEQHFRAIAANAALIKDYNWELQCILTEAFIRSMDTEYMHRFIPTLDRCREKAKSLNCYTAPHPYRDAHTQFMSFYWYPPLKESEIVDGTWGEIVLFAASRELIGKRLFLRIIPTFPLYVQMKGLQK